MIYVSLKNILNEQYLSGRIANKYNLANGNLALVLNDANSGERYLIEFKTKSYGPCLNNLFGLINEPFKKKADYLEQLLTPGQEVDLAVSDTKGPIKQAYWVYSVSDPSGKQTQHPKTEMPYGMNVSPQPGSYLHH